MKDYIWIKWGTLKEVQYSTVEQFAALKRYHDRGPVSMGAMQREDNSAQKQALCDLIDAISKNGGDVIDAWTMKTITVAEAKRWVMESK